MKPRHYLIEYKIKPYLVRRHKYYEVSLFFTFASPEAYKNFLRAEKYYLNHDPNMEEYDERHHLYVRLTPEGQRYYYGFTKEGTYVGEGRAKHEFKFEPWDKRRDNLYKDKYFLKSVQRLDRKIKVTVYLKPSCSITYALREVKRRAKAWYKDVLNNHGHHPLDSSHGKPLKRIKRKVEFLDHETEEAYFTVSEIKSESAKDLVMIHKYKNKL